jgi:hypothetical protein
MVELSPAVYMALLALVREELQVDSDASPLLRRVEAELARAVANDRAEEHFAEHPHHLEALRRAGVVGRA